MKRKNNYKWVVIVTLMAFGISLLMSFISSLLLDSVSLTIAILITFIFILIGILFDIIGVSVTSGDATAFHSMSARKVKGGRLGVKLMSNADKVASFCCDVIGDICGIVSGTSGVVIVTLIVKQTDMNALWASLIVTSLISSMTIGGKAMGKNLAISKSTEVVTAVVKSLSIFCKK